MRNRILGNGGLFFAIILGCLLSAFDFFFGNPQRLEGNLGICFPSPNLWVIPDLGSAILNLIFIVITGVALHLFNKTYNFVSSTDTIFPASFIILCCANPWIGGLLSSSILMALANLMSMSLLFGAYRSRNATQQLFVCGSICALGAMFEYAFLLMIPAYIISAMLLKCFNFKGLVAIIMGIAAPFWVGVGLGIVPLDSFEMPTFTNLLNGFETNDALLIGLLNCGLTILITFLLTLDNAMKLYAGNTRRRLFNNSLIALGSVCAICIACDTDNIPVYMATLYMVMASQLANLFALHNLRYGKALLLFLLLLYLAAFILMETGIQWIAAL